MASTTSRRLLFSFFITVFAISAAARPCKTIFFITSSSSQSQSHDPTATNSHRLTFFVTQIRQFHRSVDSSSSDDVLTSHSQTYYSSSYASSVKTSIRDRTMDIMSIVGALLFGVGCGALTAATMYLIWSIFFSRWFDFCGDSDEEEEEEFHYHDEEPHIRPDEIACVDIPGASKPVPPSAEEVDAMKSTNR
ncbi:unnamed protein product [Lactuca saligna]|uniref:Transmembrane protein n=1 Tax=Lactuca saligna TaxID=75948 RepID=A0AA35VNM7_LACSI|nr:unnamed protein product [Lactuca saligna]